MVESSAIVPSFRGYQARPRWELADPRAIETWGKGLNVLESYGYFESPEPRLANFRWMARIFIFRDSARVIRLGLSGAG